MNRLCQGRASADEPPTVSSAGHEPAWAIFRFGVEYPQVSPGMRFPLAARGGFWKQMMPDRLNSLPTRNPTVPALAQRLDGAVPVSHSQSGIYPFQAAALARVATGDMVPYRGLPIRVLWGDRADLAPRWAPRRKACRDIAAAADAAGGTVAVAVLPGMGIRGNARLLMQDGASLPIADWQVGWLAKAAGPRG